MSAHKSEAGSLAQCFGKSGYRTLERAESVAEKCMRLRQCTLRVYWCGMCCRYHLTSKRRTGEVKR